MEETKTVGFYGYVVENVRKEIKEKFKKTHSCEEIVDELNKDETLFVKCLRNCWQILIELKKIDPRKCHYEQRHTEISYITGTYGKYLVRKIDQDSIFTRDGNHDYELFDTENKSVVWKFMKDECVIYAGGFYKDGKKIAGAFITNYGLLMWFNKIISTRKRKCSKYGCEMMHVNCAGELSCDNAADIINSSDWIYQQPRTTMESMMVCSKLLEMYEKIDCEIDSLIGGDGIPAYFYEASKLMKDKAEELKEREIKIQQSESLLQQSHNRESIEKFKDLDKRTKYLDERKEHLDKLQKTIEQREKDTKAKCDAAMDDLDQQKKRWEKKVSKDNADIVSQRSELKKKEESDALELSEKGKKLTQEYESKQRELDQKFKDLEAEKQKFAESREKLLMALGGK